LGGHIELAGNHLFVHRYVPGKRCIVKLDLEICGASGMPAKRQCFFAKFYSAGRGARVYENCQQLWRCGFSRGPFTIAEPVAYDSTWQVLLLNSENGPSLRDIVLAGRDALPAVEGAAEWLYRLHTCGFPGGRVYHLSRHLHILGAWERRLASADRETGRAFGDVLDRIKRRFPKAETLTWAPTHRDFSPEHLIVEGQRFTALDFDEFCQYDPLFDVAHFLAHLRFLALISSGAVNSLDELAARFEDCYASKSRSFSAARLHLFAAIAYLKLAYVEAVVRHNKEGKQVVEALLGEAGRFAEVKNAA
jgi:Phosphotransferase enzyme family